MLFETIKRGFVGLRIRPFDYAQGPILSAIIKKMKHLIFEAKKGQSQRAREQKSRSRNSSIFEEAAVPVRRTGATASGERLSGSF